MSSELMDAPDQVRGLYHQTTVSTVGNFLGVLVAITLYFGVVPSAYLALWAMGSLAVLVLRVVLYLAYQRKAAGFALASRTWGRLWCAGVLMTAASWGVAGVLLPGRPGTAIADIALLLVVYSMSIGGVPLLSRVPSVLVSYVGLCLVPASVHISFFSDVGSAPLFVVILLIVLATLALGRRFRATFDQNISLKVHAESLVTELRGQKAAAEHARIEAEAALRAKTQILRALASNLQQPVHTALLASAAAPADERGTHAPQMQDLLVEIDHALGELLDSAAGGDVEQSQPNIVIELAELFERLQVRFENLALARNVRLGLHSRGQRVQCDPGMLESMLAELLDNAIKNSWYGTVLLTARPLGDRVRVQVWDTGSGIPEAELGKIYDDYYTLPQRPRPLGDNERQGLGRGLAKVRRWAHATGVEVGVRSRTGRGSVFTLAVARAGTAERAPEQASGHTAQPYLRGSRVLLYGLTPSLGLRLAAHLQARGAEIDVQADATAVPGTSLLLERPFDLVFAAAAPDRPGRHSVVVRQLRALMGEKLPVVVLSDRLSGALLSDAVHFDFRLLPAAYEARALDACLAASLGLPHSDRDPTFAGRLMRDERVWAARLAARPLTRQRLGRLAERGFHFSRISSPAKRAARGDPPQDHIVLLHGGLSSALGAFDAWLPPRAERRHNPDAPWALALPHASITVWRFDHDSFLPIEKSVDDLVKVIADRVVSPSAAASGRVLFAGHSRGGLVLRYAAGRLEELFPAWEFAGITAGAPHAGTTFFKDLGEKFAGLSNCVARMRTLSGELVPEGKRIQLEILERAFSYSMPRGFLEVEPHVISRFNAQLPSCTNIASWGGVMQGDCGAIAGGSLLGLFASQAGSDLAGSDGLVARESALAFGRWRFDASPAFHTSYFANPSAKASMEQLMAEFFSN